MNIDLDDLFYRNFPADFHIYLITILKNILEDPTKHPELFRGIEKINEKDVSNSVKVQIRAMYYQSIETLFELIFALERILEGKSGKRGLWYNLSSSPYRKNYERISKSDFSFLDKKYSIEDVQKNKLEVTLAHYIFFFNFQLNQNVLESIEAIKAVLKIFARDFSDRDQYNAFKHSLRVFRTIKSIKITKKDSQKSEDEIAMKDSISYLKINNDYNKNVSLISKALDTTRDCHLALLSSRIISNIFRSRRSVKLDRPEFIYFFTTQEVKDLSKHSDNLSTVRLNFR